MTLQSFRPTGTPVDVTQPRVEPLDERPRIVPVVVLLLLFASVLPWRYEAFYSGGVDAVVLAKGALSLVAVGIVLFVDGQVLRAPQLGVRSIVLVTTYLVVTVLGSWASGSLISGAVLALRVALLGVIAVLLVARYGTLAVFRSLHVALIVTSLVLTVISVPAYLSTGRLGTLVVNPNQLAMLMGAAVLMSLWEILRHRRFRVDAVVIVVLLVLLWLTGSRTGLASVGIAAVLMLVLVGNLPSTIILALTVSVPLAAYIATSTGFVSAYFDRGGGASVATLNSRTIAWKAALDAPFEFWSSLFGRGLSARTVGVSGTFWDTQVLDSSWVSAYVQAGVIGAVVMLIWAIGTLGAAFRAPHSGRALFVPFAVFLLIFSVTASGLIDAYPLFLLMFLTSIGAERTMQDEPGSALCHAKAGIAEGVRRLQ